MVAVMNAIQKLSERVATAMMGLKSYLIVLGCLGKSIFSGRGNAAIFRWNVFFVILEFIVFI